MNPDTLIGDLKRSGVLESQEIEEALRFVARAKFVPNEMKEVAYKDQALTLGGGHTMLAPRVVVYMLETLCIQLGNTVLDIGSGTGWQTTLLAQLVGPNGKVLAVERVPELCAQGQRNSMQYPMLAKRIDMRCGSAAEEAADMLRQYESIDRIIVSSEMFTEVPTFWLEQLSINGIIVYPYKDTFVRVVRTQSGFSTEEFPKFSIM